MDPISHDLMHATRESPVHLPVIGEVELAADFLQGDTIGVTGSNQSSDDLARLAAGALRDANLVRQIGMRVGEEGVVPVTAGEFLADADQIAGLVIGLKAGHPVFLSDVAEIRRGADLPSSYVWHGAPPGGARHRRESVERLRGADSVTECDQGVDPTPEGGLVFRRALESSIEGR